jgi:hypothetical protein
VKVKKTATKTFNLLCQACGENTLLRPRLFKWHNRFSEGREDVKDDEQPGCPVTIKTNDNVEKVRTLVRMDRRLGIRMMAEKLNMGKETVRQVLTTNFNMKHLFAKMAPNNPAVFNRKTNTNARTRSVIAKS